MWVCDEPVNEWVCELEPPLGVPVVNVLVVCEPPKVRCWAVKDVELFDTGKKLPFLSITLVYTSLLLLDEASILILIVPFVTIENVARVGEEFVA